MKVQKFINKLRCHEYSLWIMKDYTTLYDGSLDDFININQYKEICKSKIKWFYFVKTDGRNQIVIHLKEI